MDFPQDKAFAKAHATVKALAADFRTNSEYYLSPAYQEAEARQDFIDKFFVALGWDVLHAKDRNPYAQEVKVERGVAMSEGRKRADYSFAIRPDFRRVRFYVEAKKPSVEIKNRDNYFQAMRYGWNGATPLVVLTDFEQFHVLDSRRKPSIENSLEAAVRTYHYDDYDDPERFAEIYYLFGREAVADGSIERFAREHLPTERAGRSVQGVLFHGSFQSIDESFLRDLDAQRANLARAFKDANPHLDSEALTEAAQRTLDRLVFVRFLEDKIIEPEPILPRLAGQSGGWRAFQRERDHLNRSYNGNLFKPHLIDNPSFSIDDPTFRDLCGWLAADNSPYLFSAIPIHILGSIYERFLGSVIVVEGEENDRRAIVAQKPEVRKAGGVYYTPDYIVRHIVENTVGKLLAGKTPAQVAKMRFADIACGSGSFLLGVYDLWLRWHSTFYNALPSLASAAGCELRDGSWFLTIRQKCDILTSCVFGVDIDPQAVEVAQLSLYLKLLETETTATVRDSQRAFGAILPDLSKNIVCGNALVGWDIFGDGDIIQKVNPMDFEEMFRDITRAGGFDAIVGNPPYIRIQTMQETLPVTVPYYKARYVSARRGNYDIYVLFIERALQLLQANGGRIGYIVPHKFFNAQYGACAHVSRRAATLRRWCISATRRFSRARQRTRACSSCPANQASRRTFGA